MDIYNVLDKTDWTELAQQKRALLDLLDIFEACTGKCADPISEHMDGLLNWIDAIQDAAAHEGFPVIWLTEEEI